jgi:hypothetical protein
MKSDSISYTGESEKERLEKNSVRGTRIVIFGALASMLLWFTVLITGDPIKSFGSVSISNLYAVAISMPAAVISIYALIKVGRRK